MNPPSEPVFNDIVAMARATAEIRRVDGGQPFVIIPANCKIESLAGQIYNKHMPGPERKSGTIKVLDDASFCEYYRLFRDDHSRIFADETNNKFLGILDYHRSEVGEPRWGEHRVELTLRHSEEWTTWKAADGKKFNQMEFAEFIEDNTPDIVSPDGATMLEMTRDLRAKQSADCMSALVNPATGSLHFSYTESVKASYSKEELDIHERFNVSVPIYLGSPNITLTARLRFRLNQGKLTLWFDLLRAHNAEREGFKAVHQGIASKLSATLINGTPA